LANFGTLESWIKFLDVILVDPKRKAWSEEARAGYITLALDALKESRPDAFTEEIPITLTPGASQKLPEGAMGIVGRPTFLCTDKTGAVVTGGAADIVDANTIAAFAHFPSCPTPTSTQTKVTPPAGVTVTTPCSQWSLQGVETSPNAPGYFTVSPPVPAGMAPVIMVKAQQCSPTYTWPEDASKPILCRHKAALLEQVLYYVYSTPQESELALQRAVAHGQRFERLLGFQYRMQSKFNSGYFLGRKPDGQPDETVALR
jgi:hypothetical protein